MLETIKTIRELAFFLIADETVLRNLDPETSYRVFTIPKPGSTEKRLIETPVGLLRNALDRLADGLQWLYQQRKTEAAYGFIRSIKNDPDKRNIYTNAKRHLGKKYLLNIDLDNFFHQVDETKVRTIFSDYTLFSFRPETEELLVRLVNYRGRLPMGSPTSPPLSNFATMGLDVELLHWARRSSCVYTRYVDDLSFSSNHPITDTHFRQISDILQSHRFVADAKKIKWFGKDDIKEVTGLLLADRLQIPAEFLLDLGKELDKYSDVVNYAHQYPDYRVLEWVEKLGRTINGRLAFVAMIYGEHHEVYRSFYNRFIHASQPDEMECSMSWRYAGYDFH